MIVNLFLGSFEDISINNFFFEYMTKTYAKTYNFLKKLLLSRNSDNAIKKYWLNQNSVCFKVFKEGYSFSEESFTALSPVLAESLISQKYPMANRVKDS